MYDFTSKKVLVAGAGGFIGGHLSKRLVELGANVSGADIKLKEQWWQQHGRIFEGVDLREHKRWRQLTGFDVVFHLAADMGGIGYISSHHSVCTLNALITLNALRTVDCEHFVYTSSACVYPANKQTGDQPILLEENDVYPAMPEDGYGWEKLFGERACYDFARDNGVPCRVARLHNVYGPHGSWNDGREKAPAALCRKVAMDDPKVWGDGTALRSYLWVGDCVEALLRMCDDRVTEPLNVGTAEVVSVDGLARMIRRIAHKDLPIEHVEGARGVDTRGANFNRIKNLLGWEPTKPLVAGLEETYAWVSSQCSRLS